MVVRAAGDETEAFLHQAVGEDGGVLHDLLAVGLELGLEGLAEADGLGCDDVLERAALRAGEHGGVDLLGEVDGLHLAGLDVLLGDLVLAEDQAAAGAAEGLMRGGGDHVGIGHGAHVDARSDEAGDMRHIDHEVRADGIGDLTELGKVDLAGIGGGAREDHLGLALLRDAIELIVVDLLGLIVKGVGDLMEILTGDVDRAAVGQMAAVGEVHAHVGVAGLEHRLEGREVRARAGVGLDVRVLGAEELAGALTGDLLGLVNAVAAAVVTLAGIALGVLVGQAGAHRQHNGGGDDVLRGDQLDVALLAVILVLDGRADLGIVLGQVSHGFLDHDESSSSLMMTGNVVQTGGARAGPFVVLFCRIAKKAPRCQEKSRAAPACFVRNKRALALKKKIRGKTALSRVKLLDDGRRVCYSICVFLHKNTLWQSRKSCVCAQRARSAVGTGSCPADEKPRFAVWLSHSARHSRRDMRPLFCVAPAVRGGGSSVPSPSCHAPRGIMNARGGSSLFLRRNRLMSPTSIILCMAACFVGLVAALIVVNRFGSMSTRKLVVIAMMVAVYVVLNTVGTIRLGWINISVSALPIIVGALLYGPGGGLMVGLVGAFLGQLMTYGVTATTVLWIIPPAVRGLLIGLYAKRCGYELSRKQLVGVLIVTSLVVTLLNTGAIYLDSVIYGYYTYAYVFGKVGIRIVSGAVTAVAMAFVTPPVLDMLKRSLRAAQRA